MRILFNGYQNLLPHQKTHGYGGPHNFLELFIRELKKTEHNFLGVVFQSKSTGKVSLKNIKDGQNSWLVIKKRLGIKEIIGKGRLPKDSQETIDEIKSAIKKYNPDVAFLNGFSVSNWYLLMACSELRIPVLAVHHGLWFKEVQDIKGVTSKAVNLTRKMELAITDLSQKEVFLNQFSLKEYEKSMKKVPSKKLEFVPLPFHPDFVTKKPLPKNKGANINIGTVGRWDPIKNPAAFLSLAKESRAKNLPWKFFSVTQVNDRKNLLHIKKEYLDNIEVVDQMPPKKLSKFYAKMNLMVMTSRFDVSPAVVMEAALQNVGTVISPNVGWVSTYKKLGMKNWIDNFSNPKKSIDRIQKLLKAGPNKKFVNYIKKSHSPKAIMGRYIKLLESLTSK